MFCTFIFLKNLTLCCERFILLIIFRNPDFPWLQMWLCRYFSGPLLWGFGMSSALRFGRYVVHSLELGSLCPFCLKRLKPSKWNCCAFWPPRCSGPGCCERVVLGVTLSLPGPSPCGAFPVTPSWFPPFAVPPPLPSS